MNVNEYRRRVLTLLEEGEHDVLEQATECVLWAGTQGYGCGKWFDDKVGLEAKKEAGLT